jgi:hypothetical protein
MTVTTGARGRASASAPVSSCVKASGSSSAAVTALWPISSTTIIAVSWSSDWLMVTIWPSFISCLITSEAFTDILCASSATVIVSGTCTSITRCSTGAACTCSSRSSRPPRRPRGPPRHELRPTPPVASPRVGMAFFLVGSLAQLEESLADLTSLPPPGAAGAAVPGRVVVAGLCSVPLAAGLPASPGFATGFASSGFLATSTFFGADIIERMAAASASAFLRRSARSTARAASSSARAFDSASAFARASACAATRAACASSASFDAVARSVWTFSFFASSLAACAAARSSASRSRRSVSSRSRRLAARSSSCRRISSAWRRASSSRRASSASSTRGAAGAGAASGSGASMTAVSPPSSRLTKVRFLRTSTWMVRALPEASACLISLVDFFVSVIFLRSAVPAAVPWLALR